MELGPCIEGKGFRCKQGYVLKGRKGKICRLHRLVWEDAHGPIPPGMKVCHKCDNPPCCRLDHLFLGTQKDNVRDCIAKGRFRTTGPKGSKNASAKLTEEGAIAVMARLLVGESQRSIARSLGMNQTTIGELWRGETWSWLFKTKDTTHNI